VLRGGRRTRRRRACRCRRARIAGRRRRGSGSRAPAHRGARARRRPSRSSSESSATRTGGSRSTASGRRRRASDRRPSSGTAFASATSFATPVSSSSSTRKLLLSSQPTAGISPFVRPDVGEQLLPVGVAELDRRPDLVAELAVRGGDPFELLGCRSRPRAVSRSRGHGAAGREDGDCRRCRRSRARARSRFGARYGRCASPEVVKKRKPPNVNVSISSRSRRSGFAANANRIRSTDSRRIDRVGLQQHLGDAARVAEHLLVDRREVLAAGAARPAPRRRATSRGRLRRAASESSARPRRGRDLDRRELAGAAVREPPNT
jgi:hypothetical protein